MPFKRMRRILILSAALALPRLRTAWILTAVLAVSGFVLLKVTQQLWSDSSASQARGNRE